MIIIKLGGSLLASGWLAKCLEKIENGFQGKMVVIVPGGGVLVEQVRKLQQEFAFNDRTAHCMALKAMQQMALLMNGLKPEFVVVNHCRDLVNLGGQNRISIWSPDIEELDAGCVPSTWEITSDSLAAWLAAKLEAEELILVKSVKISADVDIRKLAEENVVDASFDNFTLHASFSVNVVHADQFIR